MKNINLFIKIFFLCLCSSPVLAADARYDSVTGRLSVPEILVGSDVYSAELVFNNGCFVLDSATQVTTQSQAIQHGQYLWEDTPHTIYDQGINWYDAQSYCENLELQGNSLWRLPSISELESIVDRSRPNPPLIIDSFTYAEGGPYWSQDGHDPFLGTGNAGTFPEAYIVDFHSGLESGYVNKETSSILFARCISDCTDGQCNTTPTTDPVDQPACNDSDLQTIGEPGYGDLAYANQYCQDLGGHLPSLDDMRVLFERDNGAYPPGFDGVVGLWTSDRVDGEDDGWWTVYFLPDELEQIMFGSADGRSVMCVTNQCAN
jgi:hypothetical protein